jgi:prepilin-type N-terminal cleavage/methylation domain-containing protein
MKKAGNVSGRFSGIRKSSGFTLIEILVVIGIVAVLAAIVIVAINPARQFAQARNSQRQANVAVLLNAIGQRLADNKGVFAGGSPNCPALTAGVDYRIAKTSGSGSSDIDLSCLTPTYIPSALPYDPSVSGAYWTSSADYNTEYHVTLDAQGRYTVSAPGALSETSLGSTPPAITVTR